MSLLYRMPVSALLRDVPLDDIRLMSAFLSVEPAPEERLEWAIAQLTALWAHAKRGDPDAQCEPPSTYLTFRKAWETKPPAAVEGLDENDLGVMNALHRRPH